MGFDPFKNVCGLFLILNKRCRTSCYRDIRLLRKYGDLFTGTKYGDSTVVDVRHSKTAAYFMLF